MRGEVRGGPPVRPQGWPIAASSAMRPTIAASATLACTVPAGPQAPNQSPMPWGERSTWPQSVRSPGASSLFS